ncbi:hypothetical protein ACTNA4_14260 [Bariatricus sp. HCP28S3_A7]|uniref:hypothetical protein n=1 Tax=Bariatricus sp. HCP28S3_A7 TaxID=3438894 RepID=UPI003F8AFEE2
MAKVYETFEHDIKRKFDDVMTVEDSDSIKAIDIEEYVLTQNVEEILGNFVAYFFDDEKEFPELRMKTQLLQDTYRDKIGPGVWIRGFFGAGKSHLLKVIYTIFSKKEISYMDENGVQKELNVVDSICSKIRSSEITELVKNIHPEDYMTFIFSANHIAKSGDTVVDCLPKEISRQLGIEYDEDKTYSAMDVAEFLKTTLKSSGKRRMLIFIDEILDLLDNADKVRKFEGLVELLPDNIWMVVTSLEAKTKLLDTVSAERMIHRFGEEQILKPEEMVWIVKNRYLAKNDLASEIESKISIDKMKYIFGTALYTSTEDGEIQMRNVIASYPFYPFQLAYMKDMLKNESKGSARNMMKTVKSIMKRPEVYNQEIGYFVGTDLIYEELKSKRSIEDEYNDLIVSLESDPILDDKQNPILDKTDLLTILKAIVLLSQVKAEGVKDTVILPFVYSDRIPNKDVLLNWLDILVRDNYINNEGGFYTPITKKESDVWSRIKGITSITETAIREKAYEYIYNIYNASLKNGKHLIEGKINDTKKSIAFVLKKSDESNEFPNAYTCIPFESDIETKKSEALAASNDREKIYIIPEKKYDGDALGKAIKFYLQMDEALEREGDFGIDAKLRIQIETKRDTAIAGKIEGIISECFKNAIISYNGQDNKDFAKEPSLRLTSECEKMLKKRYSMFFGKNLRESVDKFIAKEILNNSIKMTSSYLKDLDLIDASGNVNSANRYYSEFLKAFPDNGFDRDGATVIDDFSKGKYGWELDTIKIMVALALRNSDIKISHEGKIYVIPDDAAELTGSKGPLTARKRDVFDACKLTRINISDESIRDAIKLLKTIDSNIAVNQKLKDVAENIRRLMSKLKSATIDAYSSIVSQEVKEEVACVCDLVNDILGRKDAEDTIIGFNSLVGDSKVIEKFRRVLYIADNASNISIAYRLVALMETCNSKDKNQAVEVGKRFIAGENKQFDTLKKLYILAFNQDFDHYKKTYDGYVTEIKKMEEWEKINVEQRKQVIDALDYINVSGVVISPDMINASGLGTLEKLKDKQNRLESSYAKAVTMLHTFNDENSVAKDEQPVPIQEDTHENKTKEEQEHLKKKVSIRVTKDISDYMPKNKVINVDGEDGIVVLDSIFNEIKEQIKKDIREGKKITLQL